MRMSLHFLCSIFLILNISMSYAEVSEISGKPVSLFPRIVQLGSTNDAYFVVCHANDCPQLSFKHLKTIVEIDPSDNQHGFDMEADKDPPIRLISNVAQDIDKESATPIQAKHDQKNFNKKKTTKKRKRQRSTCLKKSS